MPFGRGKVAPDCVLTVEALAMPTDIAEEKAQHLIDRLGDDRAAIEVAARSLAVGNLNFSK
jgi:hypothetical protein